jgi:hypothetical protein
MMASAPRDASDIYALLEGGSNEFVHWAEGGGEDQPPFRGWFRRITGCTCLEVTPVAWRPLTESEAKVRKQVR